nr:hypothetical protein [uncultured Rhodopila sp.]
MNGTVTSMAIPKLDLRKAWDALTPEIQAEFGMAAIAIGFAHLVTMIEEHEVPAWQIAAEAEHTSFFDAALLEGASRAGVLVEAKVLGGDIAQLRAPSLAALGIRQCTGCGCTDQCGCPGGCHWVGPLTCSSCGEAA